MNKEELLSEINNNEVNEKYFPARSDCCDIEGRNFKDITLDNIECYRMTFENCVFENVRFIDNTIQWIEFNECRFENTTFTGHYDNVLLTVMDSSFRNCEIKNLFLGGFDEQSEIAGCEFDNCTFSDIQVEADLSVLGSKVRGSKGFKLRGKMNVIHNVLFKEDIFEDIVIDAAIIKNTFNSVQINKISFEGECVNRNNKYEDCYINGSLKE